MAALDQMKEFEDRVISIDRVARVVKGGRRFRFRATVVVGDRRGRVGVGVGKGSEVMTSIAKAVAIGKRNLITVPMYGTTIPHEVTVRFSGAQVMLKPASAGTGVIAGGAVRSVVELAGIHDILTKSLGSSNKINNAYATLAALTQLQARPERPQATKPDSTAGVEVVAIADAVKTESTDKPAIKPKTTTKKAASAKPAAKSKPVAKKPAAKPKAKS